MRYPHPLIDAVVLDRRKRFLADVRIGDLQVVAHLANTGAMTGCWASGSPCRLSHSDAPHRTLPWSVEQIHVGHWVLVNTARPNRIVEEAIREGLPELGPVTSIAREPRFPEGGRSDLLLDGRIWVEVKNATWVDGDTVWFPDARTTRGTEHLAALTRRVQAGDRAILFLHVGAAAGSVVRPAGHVDPAFADGLRAAVAAGVEVIARRVVLSATEASLGEPVPVELE